MSHLAPRSQWVAVSFLAILILAVLIARIFRKDLPPSGIPPVPMIVAVQGDIQRPGTYVMEGPEVMVTQVIETAGGLRNGPARGCLEGSAHGRIHNGQLVRVTSSDSGSLDIRVEAMPAAARLTLGKKLNLNNAAEDELLLVPQMKAGFALAIVKRRGMRPWQRLDELEEIPGIGPKTIEKWRTYLEANDNNGGGEHGTSQ
jgi:competence protein ComEA